MDYDKQRCINNIKFLAKAKGINLGDLETGAGVSAGYLSRLSKEDSKSSPSIEMLTSVARKLGVSLDGLISYDYAGMSATERYIIDFIEKLISGTMQGNQDWEKESSAVLNGIELYPNGTTSHPLFDHKNGVKEYKSYFATDGGTSPAGDFFNTGLTGNDYLYLAKVTYPNVQGEDFEIYIAQRDGYGGDWSVEPVCATNPAMETVFDKVLSRLYGVVKDACRNVKINNTVRRAIDRFMTEEVDDDDGELPF